MSTKTSWELCHIAICDMRGFRSVSRSSELRAAETSMGYRQVGEMERAALDRTRSEIAAVYALMYLLGWDGYD